MAIWLLCVPVYYWSIVHDPGESQQDDGIYQVFPANRIDGPTAAPTLAEKSAVLRVGPTNLRNALPMAAYFSLLSAVNIGF